MSLSVDDYILQATGGPSVMDGLVSWLKTNGASNGAMADLHDQFLTAQGYSTGTLDDRWDALLVSLGYTGSLQDKLYAFWQAGGTIGGGGGGPIVDPYIDYVISYHEFNGYDGMSYAGTQVNIDTLRRMASWVGANSPVLSNAEKVSGNTSLVLNGSSYLNSADFNLWQLDGEFTIEAFINLSSTAGAGYKTIASKWNEASLDREWWLTLNPACDELQFWASTDGVNSVVASASISVSTGTWYHVAASRDSSGVIRVFFNGQEGSTTQTVVGSLYNGTGNMAIAAMFTNQWTNIATGYLDEFRFTNGVCRYTASFTPPTGSLGKADIFSAYFAAPFGYLYVGGTNTDSFPPGENGMGGVFLKPDGTKLYMIGSSSDLVREYDLSTAFDLGTASLKNVLSVVGEETAPNDLYISPDGTRLYIIGNAGVEVNQYTLSSAWDISSATHVQAFSVSTYETVPQGLYFKPDGTKMYTCGTTGDTIDEYDLSTAWDISSAVYLQEISVSAQNTAPLGVFFSGDGVHMYMIGQSGAEVNQYLLGTPWDVSTASFVRVQSFSSLGAYWNYTSLYGGWLDSTGTRLFVNGQQTVNSFTLGTAWDVSTATWDAPTSDLFGYYTQEATSTGMDFKPDGTKLYITGSAGDDVNEYTLATAWDVSTASYVQNFSVSTQESSPQGVRFSPDGLNMYTIGQGANTVNQYSLSAAWDISSASFVQGFSVGSEETSPTGLFFKPDGTKMYVVGTAGDDVNEYAVGTAWDISTATFTTNAIVINETIPNGIFFTSDGVYMYIVGQSLNRRVRKFILSTPWDITTAGFAGRIDVFGFEDNPQDLYIKPDRKKLFIMGQGSDHVIGLTLL